MLSPLISLNLTKSGQIHKDVFIFKQQNMKYTSFRVVLPKWFESGFI